jgi:DNA-binding protein WhiA
MSFSSDCKEELCRVPCDKAYCRLSELSALYMTLGTLSLLGQGRLSVQFAVESPAIARRIFVLMQKEAQIVAQLHYVTYARFGGRRKCVLTVGPKQAPTFLTMLGMMETEEDGAPTLRSTVPRVKLSRDNARRAFLRGALLGCGTLSDPNHGYHLELTVREDALRLNIAKCLQSLNVPIKYSHRRGVTSLYCKQSDQIADILTATGAFTAVTKLESMRVRRQVLGSVNRAMNCDNANLRKQMDASQKQMALISRLVDSDRFATLPPALQQIAHARLQSPDTTLEELGQTFSPPLGKSGVNHRMRRLMQFSIEVLAADTSPPGTDTAAQAEP